MNLQFSKDELAGLALETSTNLLKIEPMEVVFVDIKGDDNLSVQAFTNPGENVLYVSTKWYEQASDVEAFAAVCHECRHQYQFKQIELYKKGLYHKLDETKYLVNKWYEEVKKDEEAKANNIKIDKDFDLIEIDSVAFSSIMVRKFCNATAKVAPQIKDKVEERIKDINKKINVNKAFK